MIRSNEEWQEARVRQDAEAAKERAHAEKLWRRWQAVPDLQARRDLAVGDAEFWSWTFCERLCHESAAAADDDAGRANELADLALELVVKVQGEDPLRCRIQEYVWMHVSNARRARGALDEAEKALHRGQEFFVGGTMGILPSPIRRDRLSLIEAALLRDQGRLPEALKKVEFGTHGMTDNDAKVGLFLEEGRLHRWLGQPEPALQSLSYASRDAARTSDTRILLRIEIERGLALCDLGRHGEVQELPAALQKTADRHPVERAHLLCLKGRAAAGRDRLKEAEDALRKVLADLPDQAIAGAALLSLEVAALYSRRGNTVELKAMIEPLRQLAGAPALGRGAAATLKLFCRLAEQDKLTAERTAQFARDFPRGPAGL